MSEIMMLTLLYTFRYLKIPGRNGTGFLGNGISD